MSFWTFLSHPFVLQLGAEAHGALATLHPQVEVFLAGCRVWMMACFWVFFLSVLIHIETHFTVVVLPLLHHTFTKVSLHIETHFTIVVLPLLHHTFTKVSLLVKTMS